MVDVNRRAGGKGDIAAVEVKAEAVDERGTDELRVLLGPEYHLELDAIKTGQEVKDDIQLRHIIVIKPPVANGGDGVQQILLVRRGRHTEGKGVARGKVGAAFIIHHVAGGQDNSGTPQIVSK